MLSSKISIEEIKQILDTKASQAETRSEFNILNNKLDNVQKEFIKQIPDFVTQIDLDKLLQIVQSKADLQDMHEILETKASKQTLASALNK